MTPNEDEADNTINEGGSIRIQGRYMMGKTFTRKDFERVQGIKPSAEDIEETRLAAIGRAVIEHLKPGDASAVRDATPERVVDTIKRIEGRVLMYRNSSQFVIGDAALALYAALKKGR